MWDSDAFLANALTHWAARFIGLESSQALAWLTETLIEPGPESKLIIVLGKGTPRIQAWIQYPHLYLQGKKILALPLQGLHPTTMLQDSVQGLVFPLWPSNSEQLMQQGTVSSQRTWAHTWSRPEIHSFPRVLQGGKLSFLGYGQKLCPLI